MIARARRLRGNESLRAMVRETRCSKDALVYPIFVVDDGVIEEEYEEIRTMPGQFRYRLSALVEAVRPIWDSGIRSLLLFGIPAVKDGCGSEADAADGIVQRALRILREAYPKLYLITDVCMCEYTDHGHCGILHGHEVDNDSTLERLTAIAVSHARAGADMVAPSDMMDGRVAAIRAALDANGFMHIPIMSYAVKYASAFYGPFREAADSAPAFGDRKAYQMDYHNRREALKEALTDEREGADILMVKPAGSYLDIIAMVKEQTQLPLAAYSVSGEYAMIKAAAALDYCDEEALICETAIAAFRAGADIYISYFAPQIARLIDEGRIG
ncbi:MAG: porphobilinogen synthase [Eubacteriales bacterium]|nr:porphobilinogen synthase [Eubacteriales bacterium]